MNLYWITSYICSPARVAKLVDAPSSGGGAARCAGSNPVPGTKGKSGGTERKRSLPPLFFLLIAAMKPV